MVPRASGGVPGLFWLLPPGSPQLTPQPEVLPPEHVHLALELADHRRPPRLVLLELPLQPGHLLLQELPRGLKS